MKYLIYRNDGIGDLITITPFLVTLKNHDENSHIHLICSDRNHEYARLLKKNNLIDEISLSVDKGKKILDFFKLTILVFRVKPDYSIVFKSSNTNFLSALLYIKSKIIGISYLNDVYKQTPSKFLQYFFFKKVTVDCRNNFKNSNHIRMVDHYKELYEKSFINLKNIRYKENYYLPKIEKFNEIKQFNIETLKLKKTILVHIDEKWKRYNFDFKEVYLLIENLKLIYENIIITSGVEYNEINLSLFEKYNIKPNNKFVKKTDKLIFFNQLKLEDLIKLISIVETIITSEGGVSHIAATYDKNLISLIEKNKLNFLDKWKPNISNYFHLVVEKNTLTNDVINYLKI